MLNVDDKGMTIPRQVRKSFYSKCYSTVKLQQRMWPIDDVAAVVNKREAAVASARHVFVAILLV